MAIWVAPKAACRVAVEVHGLSTAVGSLPIRRSARSCTRVPADQGDAVAAELAVAGQSSSVRTAQNSHGRDGRKLVLTANVSTPVIFMACLLGPRSYPTPQGSAPRADSAHIPGLKKSGNT